MRRADAPRRTADVDGAGQRLCIVQSWAAELGHRVAHRARQLRRQSAARAASASATMPYAVPVKVAAKTNIILRLVEADADGVDEEAHATKLQLTKAKLGTKLLDVMERFARHHNRRCAEGERVEAMKAAIGGRMDELIARREAAGAESTGLRSAPRCAAARAPRRRCGRCAPPARQPRRAPSHAQPHQATTRAPSSAAPPARPAAARRHCTTRPRGPAGRHRTRRAVDSPARPAAAPPRRQQRCAVRRAAPCSAAARRASAAR